LFLTLHGAGVEALGQVSCYANKTWGHVVAPTNRRPYGFDWEDWGRLDAMEVLELAQRSLGTDPRRTYLTGHSMGGHGVWQLGALYPDRFAAIAPSAGWISMYSYAGARRPENPDPRVEMLLRAASTSDTLAMVKNYAQMGVYVLHGEKDDNVPVGQAREMRKQLASLHSDFVYYERPGAGHWWGNECVDWPPIFEFFARHIKPEAKDVRQVEFTTLNPSVSCWSAYPCVPVAQVQALRPSLLRLSREPAKNTVHLTTENVALLTVITRHLELKEPVTLQIDANKFVGGEETLAEIELFRRDGGNWKRGDTVSHTERSFLRNGPFKDAFRERMVFVHGTRGMPEEQAWMYAKARYDSEVFWYRGNGSVDVLPDTRINPGSVEGRSVILYGNSATNSAWDRLLKESQVQVASGGVKVGKEIVKGDNLTCLFIQPKSGLVSSYIAAVSGTGLAGMRLTERIPYFVSGVGIPDLLVLDPTMLEKGEDGIVVSGFFGNDWSVDKGEFAWRK
jgi:pimeloyl-ACP methyl ester carboxylesterase